MNDMREMRYDGRRLPPRNARGEFRRRRRGDRGMDYGYDGRVIRSYPTIHPQRDYMGDMTYGRPYGEHHMAHEDMRHMDYRHNDYRDRPMSDMGNYPTTHMGDGHHMHGGRQGGYEPVEFMGYCTGYYGSPDHRGRDYGYDMRREYSDYRYDDYGDYGETLSDKELEHWEHKLMGQLDEREKQMFHKDTIMQRAKAMGKQMEGFGEKELYVAILMVYTDYKQTIGQNPDLAIKLAYDWLTDKDVAVKGAEKLAVYYDCIVEGE